MGKKRHVLLPSKPDGIGHQHVVDGPHLVTITTRCQTAIELRSKLSTA